MKKNFDLNFDLKQLRSFLETVRESSFTRASRKLGVGQATISHHLLQLEEALGVQLIQRTSKKFSLTEQGKMFRAFCEDHFENLDRLRGNFGTAGFRILATVAASTVPSAYILPHAVAALRASFPEYSFRTIIGNSRESIELVKEGRADMGIVGRSVRHPSLVFQRCMSDEIMLIGPPALPDSITLEQLKEIPLVVRETGSGTRAAYEKKLAEKGVLPGELEIAFECSTSEGIKEAVVSGIGAGFISSLAVSRELALGSVKIIRLPGAAIRRDFYIVHHKTRPLVPAARELIRELSSSPRSGGKAR